MAAFHGKDGSMIWAGTGTEVTTILSWTANATADVAESTSMGDSWKTYLAGFKDWTATVEVLASDAATDLAMLGGAAALLTLQLKSGQTITGQAICIGVSTSVESNDTGKATYLFQGSGALTT